jgi:hypothetical protein
LPAIDRVERRSAKDGAAAKIEAGVMQRTAHRRLPNSAIAEMTAIMGAGAADREQLAVQSREQHRIVADAAGHSPFGRDFGKRDAL